MTVAERLELLRRALAHEKQLGASGHWAYDAARHAAMLQRYHKLAGGT